MKPTERRQELLDWLNSARSLSLTEIVERFAISKMTAHRDMEILEQRRLLKRIHGGVVAEDGRRVGAAVFPSAKTNEFDCLICRRPAALNLLYSITLTSGEQRHACCPHCGIAAHLAIGDNIAMAMTADYLFGRPHPAQKSFFVLGSTVAPCCMPSILSFEGEERARRFRKGFGGVVGRFSDALDYLQQELTVESERKVCPHCQEGKK
jgi:ribosomal protein S27AE